MLYRLPEIKDQELLQEYVQELYSHNETSGNVTLEAVTSGYPDWVKTIHKNASTGDDHWGKTLLYLCFDRSKLVGLLIVRHELTEELTQKYGDIGYEVRPSERNKGYATAMLRHGLSVCREKGMGEVLVGCYKDNLASAATIQKNGGVLVRENDNYTKGKLSQYYVIKL